jgi:hypothetical protein
LNLLFRERDSFGSRHFSSACRRRRDFNGGHRRRSRSRQ